MIPPHSPIRCQTVSRLRGDLPWRLFRLPERQCRTPARAYRALWAGTTSARNPLLGGHAEGKHPSLALQAVDFLVAFLPAMQLGLVD